ncbi:MAG: PKD domain-containing protein [Bacteroidetes bacterium]|nr:PKD domain-containing protein [Bacteroidota bacterium]
MITGPDSVCINALASYGFSQPLFPGAYYSWSLSNSPKGIISSSGNNFMNLKWTVAGTDTVKVRVQANCLDTTIKYVVVISPLPTPGISVVSPACQNSNVNFTGSGGGTYSWSFAGGSPGFSSSPNPVVTYALPGNYNVSLTVVSAAVVLQQQPLRCRLIRNQSLSSMDPIQFVLSRISDDECGSSTGLYILMVADRNNRPVCYNNHQFSDDI